MSHRCDAVHKATRGIWSSSYVSRRCTIGGEFEGSTHCRVESRGLERRGFWVQVPLTPASPFWRATVVDMRPVFALFSLALLTSCGSSSYALLDRTDSHVQAKEMELTPIITAAEAADTCAVRFLGESDGASFVWAECVGPDGELSAPFRIEGTTLAAPRDGGQFANDVRRLFPAPLWEAILKNPDRLRP